MSATMNMSNFEVEQDAMEAEYGEEIMSAGWNPAVDMVCEQLLQIPTDEQLAKVANLATLETVDEVSAAVTEIFMRKIYSYQR